MNYLCICLISFRIKKRIYLKIFENTDVFDGVRLAVDWEDGALAIVDADDLIGDETGDVDIDIWDSGCIILFATCAAWIANVAGIGGGNGIFVDEFFSISFIGKSGIEEFDDKDDDGEGTFVFVFVFVFIFIVDGSSSIVFDATVRSRSFRTSRTVRWNNCWTYS